MFTTLAAYWKSAFAWEPLSRQIADPWIVKSAAVLPWLFTAAMLALLAWRLSRRDWRALFPFAWFLICIAPVLPLRDHFSEYYLTLPAIGLGLFAALAFSLPRRGVPGYVGIALSVTLTAFYLAAAGVGTLAVMDGDVVDITNLQRQILHTTADVGKPKVESATRTLKALNPDVNIVSLPTRITVDNVMEMIRDYDLIVDGSDNFETRYLVNDACFLAGKTNVHGSIFQFEGMATVFAPNQGPCYRCLYPTPPPPGLVPS